jgi:hypothetical protein
MNRLTTIQGTASVRSVRAQQHRMRRLRRSTLGLPRNGARTLEVNCVRYVRDEDAILGVGRGSN